MLPKIGLTLKFNKMAGTKVKACKCKHEVQDEIYGKGQRLHNLNPDGKIAYCTVCCIAIDPKTGKYQVNNLGKYVKQGKTA
jgi:hypothetical protein